MCSQETYSEAHCVPPYVIERHVIMSKCLFSASVVRRYVVIKVDGKQPIRNLVKMFFLSVPPKVSPFYAEDTLHVGDRASLTCSVTKGDLPLSITWSKDGRSMDTNQLVSVSVSQVDQYTSILLIESLTPEHNGNYSCVVRNSAAEVSHTHQLVVNGNERVPCHALYSLYSISHVCFSLL